MDKIPDHVIKKLGGTKDSTVTNLFYLMKELHLSYSDIKDMPVPAILMLMEELEAHAKREEAAMKKKK